MNISPASTQPIAVASSATKGGRPTATLSIRGGDKGTRDTLNLMAMMIREGRKNPIIREFALNLVRNFAQKDYLKEISTIHRFVRDKIRYVKDVNNVETLQFAPVTLEIGQGDCDDKAILAGSLLESLGHPVRLVAIATRPGGYQHVYLQTYLKNEWIGVETTEPVELGWLPKNVVKEMVVYPDVRR